MNVSRGHTVQVSEVVQILRKCDFESRVSTIDPDGIILSCVSPTATSSGTRNINALL